MRPIVLAIDDNPDDLLLLKLACDAARVSFDFQSVESGERAIAYLQGDHPYADRKKFPLPDLILLDLKMPGKSGFELLAWLRCQADFRQIPVVIFTSSVHSKDRAQALELGAEQYVVKPVGYDALQQLMQDLDRLLGSRKGMEER